MAETLNSTPNEVMPTGEALAFTLDGGTGQVLKLQIIDPAGVSRDLSKADVAEFAKRRTGPGVAALLEDAFEAGVASLLDADLGGEDGPTLDPDEASVRETLLHSLMEGSGAARALRRPTLRKAILQTLFEDLALLAEGQPEPPQAAELKKSVEPPKAAKPDRATPHASS
jgi:hypothetical protein